MYNGGSTSLKFYKRLKIYKNSTGTVQFDPATREAYSYNWKFVAPVNGVLVFNDYRWSVTTSSHQSAVWGVIRELKLPVISGDFGAVNVNNLGPDATKDLYKQLFKLEVAIESATRESHANTWRISQASMLRENISKLESLGHRFKISKKLKRELRLEAEDTELNRISDLESARVFKFLSLKRASSDLNPINLNEEF